MFEIVIDHRESRSTVYKALTSHPDVTAVVRELSSGDYLPHPSLAIERKTAEDFILSIMDNRLFAQVLRLKEEFPHVVFVIEGNPYATRSQISRDAILGAFTYLIAIEGVSVMRVDDAKETAALIYNLARHKHEGLGYIPPLRSEKPKNTIDLSRYLVEGLPGVGPKMAVALLGHFGCAKNVFNAGIDEMCKVPGVGKKSAERIRQAIDATN
jgi:ERCC4-type nuclease